MKLTGLRPMLQAANLPQTIEFYAEVLGFTCTGILRKDNGEPFWCSLEKNSVALMFTARNADWHAPRPTLTGSLYFYTDEVDALWEELKDKTKVEYPIENFFYEMREFAIRDPNGYLLQFGQPISEVKS